MALCGTLRANPEIVGGGMMELWGRAPAVPGALPLLGSSPKAEHFFHTGQSILFAILHTDVLNMQNAVSRPTTWGCVPLSSP